MTSGTRIAELEAFAREMVDWGNQAQARHDELIAAELRAQRIARRPGAGQ